MLTRDQALTAKEFHYGTCKRTIGPRGGITIQCEVWRRNGSTQTWKRDPENYRVPVKHGMRSYGNIFPNSAANMHTSQDCPLNK